MKTLLLLSLSFFLTTSAFAERKILDYDEPLMKKLDQEVQKDLEGTPSCFKGKVRAKFEEMQENYGGRFGESYNLEVMKISETGYRSRAKYCGQYLDRELNPLPDDAHESSIVYRQCISTDSSRSIAGVMFGASTSGTFEMESVVFSVDYKITHDLIVNYDASYFPEESEIRSYKTTEEMECTIIE